jgi:hypothetical protein
LAALHFIPKFVKNMRFTENILASNLGWQKEKYIIEVGSTITFFQCWSFGIDAQKRMDLSGFPMMSK